jgi:hypothetical protein
MPDSVFVAYMRDRGYYGTYGDVRLRRDPGEWRGSLDVDRLSVIAECRPTGPVEGRVRGMRVLVPPCRLR